MDKFSELKLKHLKNGLENLASELELIARYKDYQGDHFLKETIKRFEILSKEMHEINENKF